MSSPSDIDPRPQVVLVAEDDMLIRMMAVDALTDAGFAVIEAGQADEALNILGDRAPQVRALFTDIHMPGTMSGLELARHVRDHWPWIVVVVASGKARPSAEELPPGSRFLPKPYQPGHVVRHVCELLGAG